MTLGEKLQKLRKARAWTQEELAEQVGVSRQSLSKWESAGALPDTANVIILADLFGVTTDYLLREGEASPAAESPRPEAPAVSTEPPAVQVAAPVVQFIPPQKKASPPTIFVIGCILAVLGALVWLGLEILSIIDPVHFYQGQQHWDGIQGYIRSHSIQWLYYASLAAMAVGLVTDAVYWLLQRWFGGRNN